jgi:hypothetical protein
MLVRVVQIKFTVKKNVEEMRRNIDKGKEIKRGKK